MKIKHMKLPMIYNTARNQQKITLHLLAILFTIVSPARYYSESIPGGIDWFQTGKFIDPCEAANIQQEQFLVLIRFLDEMITGLQQTAMADKINFDGIYFRNDIGHQVRKNFSKEN